MHNAKSYSVTKVQFTFGKNCAMSNISHCSKLQFTSHMIELIHKFVVLLRNFEVHFTQSKHKKAGLNPKL